MQTQSETLQKAIKHLKKHITKEIIDIIIFGSTAKGKKHPEDLDIAIITNNKKTPQIEQISKEIQNTHSTIMNPSEFFNDTTNLTNTLLREGYSIKHNKPLIETIGFKPKTLFTYDLKSKKQNEKVKIIHALKGRNGKQGIAAKNGAEWISKNTILAPTITSEEIEQALKKNNVNYKKTYMFIY